MSRQTEIMVKNILGNGIDIPLLGLREASREVTGSLHELFTDESYAITNCFLLSTSQVGGLVFVNYEHFVFTTFCTGCYFSCTYSQQCTINSESMKKFKNFSITCNCR